MKYFCKELNKEFDDRVTMFVELKANQERILGLKKAAIKYSEPVCLVVRSTDATKAIVTDETKIGVGDYIYPIINTTNWLDSHGDVHIDGIWDNSVKDNKGKLHYIINHELELGKVISYPDEVEAYVKGLDWSELGIDYTGTTQALIYKALLTEASNKDALNAIINKKPIQNSVRMSYIQMVLCIDDSGDDFKQEYANFYKYLAVIANKQAAIDAGYFWAILEAKIVKEGSAVLFGSNESTPILYVEPGSTTQQKQDEVDPLEAVEKSLELIKGFKFLTN